MSDQPLTAHDKGGRPGELTAGTCAREGRGRLGCRHTFSVYETVVLSACREQSVSKSSRDGFWLIGHEGSPGVETTLGAQG